MCPLVFVTRIQYQNGLNNETLNELVSKVKDLNREIALDKSLGKGFCIGHSYFCGRDICTDEWLRSVVDYDNGDRRTAKG